MKKALKNNLTALKKALKTVKNCKFVNITKAYKSKEKFF